MITKSTYVLYKRAQEINIDKLNLAQLQGLLEYRCIVSNEILVKIQEGAKKSINLQERFYKYFDLF